MSRRPGSTTRRLVGNGGNPLGGLFHSKSKASPLLSVVLVLLGTVLVIGYVYKGSGGSDLKAFSKLEDSSCTFDVHTAIPILKKTYGDCMHKVLHVGPDTCSIVSQRIKEDHLFTDFMQLLTPPQISCNL